MSYHEWVCPECGELTVQPDWILDVYCMKTFTHKRGKKLKMIRVVK